MPLSAQDGTAKASSSQSHSNQGDAPRANHQPVRWRLSRDQCYLTTGEGTYEKLLFILK